MFKITRSNIFLKLPSQFKKVTMWLNGFFEISVTLVLLGNCLSNAQETTKARGVTPAGAWKWVCEEGRCEKTRVAGNSTEPALSLDACKMFCNDYGLLWPKPTGEVTLGNFLSKININKITVNNQNTGASDQLVELAGERFLRLVETNIPNGERPSPTGKALDVYLLNENPHVQEFSLHLDESYTMRVHPVGNDKIKATISAQNFFGLRHGLETLSQLVLYDDIIEHLVMVRDVNITDEPAHPYRGILLDTSRNYYSVESLKSTIDAMAAVKLNTFHWHITDSHSFPFVSERRPELHKLGAYSPKKVYTKEAIQDLVKFGQVRGVRVMPEFDAPAHVGEGWQDSELTVCFAAQPWQKYCVEPPCGQFNPVKEELYDYLEDIYRDMDDAFKPDIFHMGGDEVSEKCWNTSSEIQQFITQHKWDLSDKSSFLKLWDVFQRKAQDRAYKAFGKKLPLILWTSTLTKCRDVEEYLSKDDYIIQVWTTGVDPEIDTLLHKGYKLIMSNYDALYLDCGFGAWIGTGNNWCSPYIGWQKVYENSFAKKAAQYKKQILGGEAALWSEQADDATLDDRLWPRAAALAERLWSDPTSTWAEAEMRMLSIRERLIRMGIRAEALQPQWCYQNEGQCNNVVV